MTLTGFATRIFGRIIDKYPNLFPHLKEDLLQAQIKLSFRSYVSLSFFISLITSLVSVGGILIANAFLKFSFLTFLLYLTLIPPSSFLVTFLIFMFYPSFVSSSRRKDIEINLPFALMHMGAIAESGVPPYVIFRLISEFKEYGELAKEMKKIVRYIDVFGLDPLSAVKEVSSKTPSKKLRQILLGFVTTTESGGNVTVYLKNVGRQTLYEWRLKRERFIQQLSTYAEIYTALIIAGPLFMISLFAVLNLIQPTIAGFHMLDLTKIGVYGIIPLVNIGFLLFLKGVEVEI